MLENECFLPLWYMSFLSVSVQLIGATGLRATLPPFSSIPGISSRLASRSLPTDPPIRGELASHTLSKIKLILLLQSKVSLLLIPYQRGACDS
jgi:hypothetical protein